MICPSCGTGEVIPTQAEGRRWPHKTIPDLEIPREIAIPTCANCGEEWIDDETGQAIGKAAQEGFRAALLEKADHAIQVLRSASYPQRVIERLLGLSTGYFSKLRGADRDPSPHLVAALMLLANEPERVEELRLSWSVQAPEPASLYGRMIHVPFGSETLANPSAGLRPANSGMTICEGLAA